MELVALAKNFAIESHKKAGTKYGGHDYSIHLEEVYEVAKNASDMLDEGMVETVFAACWCHDLLEDTRMNYTELRNLIGEKAADLVYDVTNELGKNRHDKARKTYPKIAENPYALFVKLCDRIANTQHSKSEGSSLYDMYRDEYSRFRVQLRCKTALDKNWCFTTEIHWQKLWDILDELNEYKELE